MNELNDLTRERLEAEADARRLRLVKTLEALAPTLDPEREVVAVAAASLPIVETPRPPILNVNAPPIIESVPIKEKEREAKTRADSEKAAEPSEPELEAEADARRTRLVHIFAMLRSRFHRTVDLKSQATRHPMSLAIVGAGSLFALAEGTRVALTHLQHKREPTFLQRLSIVAKAWQDPAHYARPPRFQLAKGVALGVVSAAASVAAIQVTDRILKRIFPEPR